MSAAAPSMTASIAQHLLDGLAASGPKPVFVVPGLQIDPLVKALARHPLLAPVMANHELAAGYMADGYARASGGIGATFAIGGPGAANLVGAAITAKADRSPVLFVTGNIPAAAQGRGEFQDAGPQGSNDAAVFAAALGASASCARPGDFPACSRELCLRLQALQPAHLHLPMEVQAAALTVAVASQDDWRGDAVDGASVNNQGDADRLAQVLHATERLLLVVGAEALVFAEEIKAAVRGQALALATDASTRGLVAEDDPSALGHLGFMPHPRVQAAVQGEEGLRAQRIVAIGGSDALLAALRRRHPDVLAVEAGRFASSLAIWREPSTTTLAARRDWLARLHGIRRPPLSKPAADGHLSYADVVDAVAAALPGDAACVVDAGQVRRIAAARWCCTRPRSLFIAEGMAPMGWSLGAAIGVQWAQPHRRVVALLGDGAMRMHGLEIATAARYRLPILYILFDNGAYGTVLARMQGDAERETARLPAVDWCAFARSLGVPAVAVADRGSLPQALADATGVGGPRLVVVRVPAIEPAAHGEPTGIDWCLESSSESPDP